MDDTKPIPVEHLYGGATAAQNYAVILFRQANDLYKQKKYQESIPFAVNSTWESMKGMELISHFWCSKDLTRRYWKSIQNHKYKFPYLKKLHLKEIAVAVEAHQDKLQDMTGMISGGVDTCHISGFFYQLVDVRSNLESFHNSCIRSDWSDEVDGWQAFSVASDTKKDEIGIYVLQNAHVALDILNVAIDLHG